MKPTEYIETTVPSYYFDERPELTRDVARTRDWWDSELQDYECFISAVVVDELSGGEYPYKDKCLSLVRNLPRSGVNEEVLEIADVYWAHKLMPRSPIRDALHLVIASYYNRYFVTKDELVHTLRRVFEEIRERPSTIRGYLHPFCA